MRGAQRNQPVATLAAGMILVAALGLSGCLSFAGRASSERLDRSTGMTVGTAEQMMVFARTEARYSRSTRDYIYLAPVETNQQGVREFFLWVGVASTLDRGYLAPEIDLPTSVQLMVQGEPMVFELRPWAETIPGLTPVDAYRTPVALLGQLGARATRDQLRLVAEAAPASVRVGGSDGSTRIYTVWGEKPISWTGLLRTAN